MDGKELLRGVVPRWQLKIEFDQFAITTRRSFWDKNLRPTRSLWDKGSNKQSTLYGFIYFKNY